MRFICGTGNQDESVILSSARVMVFNEQLITFSRIKSEILNICSLLRWSTIPTVASWKKRSGSTSYNDEQTENR